MAKSKHSRKNRPPESKKISKLVREGIPQNQAVAEALSMKRAGRLTNQGGYIRARQGRHRRSSQRTA